MAFLIRLIFGPFNPAQNGPFSPALTVDDTSDEKEVVNVPIEKKLNLTIREAAEYSNIGMNKINEMLRNPMCSFVLYVGAKKLVKRKEFEQFLAGRMEI